MKKISTNPRYETFNQIYFHAGNKQQFEKFGLLKSRLLKYPKEQSGGGIFNGYNIDTLYLQTFQLELLIKSCLLKQ